MKKRAKKRPASDKRRRRRRKRTRSVEERVFSILAEQFIASESEISRETNLAADLAADSFDQVELAMELEDEFDISIPEEQKFKTVGQMIDYVKEHTGKRK